MTDTKTLAKTAIACLDLTDLNAESCARDVRDLCARAKTPHGSAAAVCVWPQFVDTAVKALKGSNIRIATVVNFPQGDHPASEVMELTRQAVADGANEIDMVIPWKLLMEGHPENVDARVARVRKAAGDAKLKAIIESGMLIKPELIAEATRRAIDGGADFVKTSTGKVPISATPEAARTILETIKSEGAHDKVGFKASGGLKTSEDAAAYLNMAAEIMGADWVTPEKFRFGASGVLDALIATAGGLSAQASGGEY